MGFSWQEVDLGNIYAKGYGVSVNAGKVDTWQECESICSKMANCTSYDIAISDVKGDKCRYLNEYVQLV
jgi:hypothetical protein